MNDSHQLYYILVSLRFSCPSRLTKVLSPMFELDPLFRRTFLLVVPCHVFNKIASSGTFAPVEIYTTLARTLSEKDCITEGEVMLKCMLICVNLV